MSDLNPSGNNVKFWTFNQTDAEVRGAELKKYAGSSTASLLSKISPQLRAVMPDLSEASSPVATPDAGDALDKARRAAWYFSNQAAATVDYSTVKLSDPVMARANFETLILEQQEQILGPGRKPLSPKKDFNTQTELADLLSKGNGKHTGQPDPATGAAQPGHEPLRNEQRLEESRAFYEAQGAVPADPARPSESKLVAMLADLAQKYPSAWRLTMEQMFGNQEATPQDVVTSCKIAARVDALTSLVEA
jgi:hypothetical protein